jgi:hypothetical protein
MTNEFTRRFVPAKRDREPPQGRSRDSLPGGVWNAARSLENIRARDLMKLLGRVTVVSRKPSLVESGGNS